MGDPVGLFRRFAELFEGGFETLNDFLAHVGIGEIVGFFEAFVSEPEHIEAGIMR
jgi:hypothetical protein